MIDEINPQCPHCIHREVCKNAETYREIVLHISNEVGNMPDWLAYRLACKDFKTDQAYRDVENVHRTTVEKESIPEKCLNIPRNYGEVNVHRTTVEETSIPEKCLNIPRNYGEVDTTTWRSEPVIGEW